MHDERPSARRIDVALMGTRYTLDHQDRFDKDAVGHLKVFLGEPVYDAYEPYFNFWKFNLASKDTGVDEVERLPVDEEEASGRLAGEEAARSGSSPRPSTARPRARRGR